jgi:hypothetical protein
LSPLLLVPVTSYGAVVLTDQCFLEHVRQSYIPRSQPSSKETCCSGNVADTVITGLTRTPKEGSKWQLRGTFPSVYLFLPEKNLDNVATIAFAAWTSQQRGADVSVFTTQSGKDWYRSKVRPDLADQVNWVADEDALRKHCSTTSPHIYAVDHTGRVAYVGSPSGSPSNEFFKALNKVRG